MASNPRAWFGAIFGELEAAGYQVTWYGGFPLVAMPTSLTNAAAFLKWRSPSGLPCCKTLYLEGALITPMPLLELEDPA